MLGCPQAYSAQISYRGGAGIPVGRVDNINGITWDRKLNELAEATVTIGTGNVNAACCRLFAKMFTDRRVYELSVYRDTELVFQGPIVKMTETQQAGASDTQVLISARDVLWYLDGPNGHLCRTGYSMTADVVNMAATLIGQDLLTDDPHVQKNVVVSPSGIVVSRAAAPDTVYITNELRALTGQGLKFTTVKRKIFLWGGAGVAPNPRTINISATDIAGGLSVTADWTAYANTIIGKSGATTSQVIPGQVPPRDPLQVVMGGPEDVLVGGRMEEITTSSGAMGTNDVSAATLAAWATGKHYRRLMLADGSQLLPTTNVNLSDLIPGTFVQLAPNGTFCTWIADQLQLTRVAVTFGTEGEKVGISLGPLT